MPQMMPIMWFILYFYFLMLLSLIYLNIYFMKFNKNKFFLSNKKKKKFIFMW